jgi:peptidylprolyl isomerase|tara:strand:+ start:133 stop:585 length:453 start_codon:yes stop_codon:yes gene_type:complete
MAKITKATKATNGHNVRVHYKGTLDDGTVFDDSRVRESTLDFELGTGNLIPGFQEAIVGMKSGQTKTFTVDCESAYGQPDPAAVVKVPKEAFSPEHSFSVGDPVMGTAPDGQSIRAVVASVEEDGLLLDHNHPLAGKDLIFEVELVEIQK